MHTIERELIKITGYQAKRKFADRQDYLKSILNAVANELTDETAAWANAAVEAHNTKNCDLPDFDEIGDPAEPDNDEGPTDEPDEKVDDPEPVSEDDEEIEEVREDVIITKPASKKAKKPASIKAITKAEDRDIATLDKWGTICGSKNSQALALFEKGATANEVKNILGGTYYNILRKMVEDGHKLEKEGSLMKLIHRGPDKAAKASPKKVSRKTTKSRPISK